MRFSVIVGTRGRPRQAAAVCEAALMMSSGKHEINCIVSYDIDDEATHAFYFGNHIRRHFGTRPIGPGEVWNRAFHAFYNGEERLVVPLADDQLICTDNWDDKAAELFERFHNPDTFLFAWNDRVHPNLATTFIGHSKWFSHLGEIYDARFPYHYSDTALAELWTFVTGRPFLIHPDMVVVGKGDRLNPRMRDVDFWWDFYDTTRTERLRTAKKIRQAVGLFMPPEKLAEMLRLYKERDDTSRPMGKRVVEAMDAAGRPPPDNRYLQAKEEAEKYLLANPRPDWFDPEVIKLYAD